MSNYIVEGGKKLEGEIDIAGSKNAALPIIAASILNSEKVEITNCPHIHDVEMMFSILEKLGCNVSINNSKIVIDASNVNNVEIPAELMHEMRSSVIIAGALIGRFGKCKFTYPGGCEIGARPINMHLEAFKQLGVNIQEENGFINCESAQINGTEIVLDFPSVGATENIMLASALATGTTYIRNVAREPEIRSLQEFLNSMGAQISGAGSNTIIIKGVKKLHETSYKVIPDRIEAGTYLCLVAGCKGEIKLNNVNPEHINSIIHKLKQVNCKIGVSKDSVYLKMNKELLPTNIKTMPYPGFPTDMQSQFVTLLSVANGTSIVVENIFENRFKYVNELIRMGANITLEGKTAIIQGVEKLKSASVEAKDLRGGAALVSAALMAEGVSTVSGIMYIKRGYEKLIEKLVILGAKIKEE